MGLLDSTIDVKKTHCNILHFALSLLHLLSMDRKFYCILLASAAVVLFIAVKMQSSTQIVFNKQLLTYKLTQVRAIELTIDQMNGTEPLMRRDRDSYIRDGPQTESPELKDIVLSMKYDAKKYGYDGICAMNYNIPVSACFVPRLGNEHDVVLYNLNMVGFSKDTTISGERSLLCDRGEVEYGVSYFDYAWIEFYDETLKLNYVKVYGKMGRTLQSMAWLNKGVTVCSEMSAQKQADILFQVAGYDRN